jgi:hypothetical protein
MKHTAMNTTSIRTMQALKVHRQAEVAQQVIVVDHIFGGCLGRSVAIG